jgi:hypothetical protein
VVVLRLSDPGHVHISAGWLDAHVAEAVIEAVDTGKLIAAIRRRQKLARPRKVSEIEARIELLEDAFYVQGKVPKARFERLRDGLLEALKDDRIPPGSVRARLAHRRLSGPFARTRP